MRVAVPLGDDELIHRCWLAYLSDDVPSDAVFAAHPGLTGRGEGDTYGASLDHAIWFHRPFRADRWHLHEFTANNFSGGRGLAIGHIFDEDGRHSATVAQEFLLRGRA
jgi:acyl-CoA thioesterase-2